MISGLIPTYGSFFFMLLMLMVYFLKHNSNLMENKIYKQMTTVVLILVITEIIASYIIWKSGNEMVNSLAYKGHWLTGLIWFFLLYYYSYSFINDLTNIKLKEVVNADKATKSFTLFSLIVFIVYIFIPFSNLDYPSFVPGIGAYYVLGYGGISASLIFIMMLKNRNRVDKRKKIAVIALMIELTIVLAVQLVYQYIAFEAIASVIQMYILYFLIENPDLKNISELEKTKSKIEKSNKIKTDFLSKLSTEILSPVDSIIELSDEILSNNIKNIDEQKKLIRKMYASGNDLLDIVDNILNISIVDSDNEKLEMDNYSLKEVLSELVSYTQSKIIDKPIELILDIDKNTPSIYYGDENKIYQILYNLLSNAVKFTEIGKIKLSISSQINNNINTLSFVVNDTGKGMKKEDQERLLKNLNDSSKDLSDHENSNGIGLLATKKYIDMMQGTLEFRSDIDVGSKFIVNINQEIVDMTPISELDIKNTKKDIQYFDCSNYRILIVDDNDLSVTVTKKLFELYNFKIDTANSGRKCIYKIKAEEKYDLILIDHMMPEMDGIETLHKLQKLYEYELPPIVVLTANSIYGMKKKYLSEGFNDYLSKPINQDELSRIVNKFFKK